MDKTAIEIIGLTKNYQTEAALYDLHIKVKAGEIIAMVGPSGCGKTTTLRLIAGFERPDAGTIILNGQPVANETTHLQPERRGVGMVFQDYALFPHLTVFENVAFGLKGKKKKIIANETTSMLRLVGLEALANRYPHELSGGQRQRVALARALAPKPVLVLLDEPFSNLDADMRNIMRAEVRAILKGINATAIFVTHDQEEALFMGDRLAVLNKGKLEQLGSPEIIFHKPATYFVAEFMGNTDFLAGEVTAGGIQTEIGLITQPVELPLGSTVKVALRVDDIAFEPNADAAGMVLARHFKGAFNIYRLRLPSGQLLQAYTEHARIIAPGTPVNIWLNAGHSLAYFPANKPSTGV